MAEASARATFVTLTQDGELRGCIGTLEAHRPLGEDVSANARAAALPDPRFPPLTRRGVRPHAIEVSLLSTPSCIAFADQADLSRSCGPARTA